MQSTTYFFPKPIVTILSLFFVLFYSTINAQSGCTDPLANNYDASAVNNDGSCTYDAANVSPVNSTLLNSTLNETSGLILWNGTLWTHNDGGNPTDIYGIDVTDLSTFSTLGIPGVTNVDWEDIAQDDNYVYIGDFGNNANGNRTDLKIYRISKTSLTQGAPTFDEISFSYSDQTDFSPQGGNNTDFDCEAFVVTDTGIFLFTKEWNNLQTTVYSMPKTPGVHSAINEGSYDVNGLITGATYIKDEQLVVLTGYGLEVISVIPLTIAPDTFMLLLYDYQGDDFLSGNKRTIDFDGQDQLQVEAIASADGLNYYLSNERYNQFNVTTEAQLHEVDLSGFLSNYLSDTGFENEFQIKEPFVVYPNPLQSDEPLSITTPQQNLGKHAIFEVYNMFGQLVKQKDVMQLKSTENMSFSNVSSGFYVLKITVDNDVQSFKLNKM